MSKFNMQNVIIWIKPEWRGGYKFRFTDRANNYLRLQVENSLRLGWPKEDIILITNFPFEYMGVEAHVATDICKWSAFVNKLVVINEMIKKGVVNDNIWLHDADAYQLVPFEYPKQCKGVGFTRHAPGRSKPQGGSVFYGKDCYDIIEDITQMIKLFRPIKEESFFPVFYSKSGGGKSANKQLKRVEATEEQLKIAIENGDNKRAEKLKIKIAIFKERSDAAAKYFGQYESRFSWLNWTYNLSQQRMFSAKYRATEKPVKVVHFHTEYQSTMDCFYYGKNAAGIAIVTPELKELFIKHELVKVNNG